MAIGGTLSALGAYIFVYLIWRTIDGSVAMQRAAKRAQTSSGKRLPIA